MHQSPGLLESTEACQSQTQDARQAIPHARRSEEPTMADVSTFEDIALPADTVWNVIGDFGGIRKWAVLVQSESVEETPAGKIRTLIMPENRTVKERLVVQSQY